MLNKWEDQWKGKIMVGVNPSPQVAALMEFNEGRFLEATIDEWKVKKVGRVQPGQWIRGR